MVSNKARRARGGRGELIATHRRNITLCHEATITISVKTIIQYNRGLYDTFFVVYLCFDLDGFVTPSLLCYENISS